MRSWTIPPRFARSSIRPGPQRARPTVPRCWEVRDETFDGGTFPFADGVCARGGEPRACLVRDQEPDAERDLAVPRVCVDERLPLRLGRRLQRQRDDGMANQRLVG